MVHLAVRDEVDCVLVRRAIRSRTNGFVGRGKVPTERLWPGSGALSTKHCSAAMIMRMLSRLMTKALSLINSAVGYGVGICRPADACQMR